MQLYEKYHSQKEKKKKKKKVSSSSSDSPVASDDEIRLETFRPATQNPYSTDTNIPTAAEESPRPDTMAERSFQPDMVEDNTSSKSSQPDMMAEKSSQPDMMEDDTSSKSGSIPMSQSALPSYNQAVELPPESQKSISSSTSDMSE